jgi:hypothetical protein
LPERLFFVLAKMPKDVFSLKRKRKKKREEKEGKKITR